MADRIFGVIAGAGVRVVETQPAKPIEAGPFGSTIIVGIFRSGPVGEVVSHGNGVTGYRRVAGGLTQAGDDLMTPVREHFRRLHWTIAEPVTEIRFTKLGAEAGVIGAAGVAWQAFAPAHA